MTGARRHLVKMTRNLSSTSANKQQGMMRHEAGLPNLPVNSLAETSARWLESIRPFVTEPGQPLPTAEKPNERYLRAQQAAEEFLDSPLVTQLQQRLQDRASKTDSWLADWWNEAAYLRPRDPLAFANYFYAHVDDLSYVGLPSASNRSLYSLVGGKTLLKEQQVLSGLSCSSEECWKPMFSSQRWSSRLKYTSVPHTSDHIRTGLHL